LLVEEAEGNADRSYPFIVGYTDYVPEIEQLVKEHNALLARGNPIVGAYTGNKRKRAERVKQKQVRVRNVPHCD